MGQHESIAVINPANEEIIGHVPRGTAEDADRAVRAAREAFRNWRWVPGLEKARIARLRSTALLHPGPRIPEALDDLAAALKGP